MGGAARHHPSGDGDGDGPDKQTVIDLSLSWCDGGAVLGNACYHAEADLDRDGDIDSADVGLASSKVRSMPPGHVGDPGSGVFNTLGWSGSYHEHVSDLDHLRMREWSPHRGRWLQRDPAGYMDSMNLYAYGWGNPVGVSDPFGLQGVGQQGEYFSSDPVMFGSSGGRVGRMNESNIAIPHVTHTVVKLIKLLDIWPGPVEPSGITIHRMTREEYAYRQWADPGHAFLDWLGNAPGPLGMGADAVNGIWYFFEGDHEEALWHLAGAVDPFGVGTKAFRTGKNAFDAANDARRAANSAEVIRRNADEAAHAAAMRSGGCFVAGTLVHTDDGKQPIEAVEPGTQVWSFNGETGKWQLQEVLGTSVREYHGDLVTVSSQAPDESYSTVVATGNHPFWVEAGVALAERPAVQELPCDEPPLTPGGRWIEARHLKKGDRLITRDGRSAVVTELAIRNPPTVRKTVYNLNVSRLHNYAVGGDGWIVHNNAETCPPDIYPVGDILINGRRAPDHHIATVRYKVADPQWTQQFADLFRQARMSMEDALNRIRVWGHQGPHSQEYHEAIFDRLSKAIAGRSGMDVRRAMERELTILGAEINRPGTRLYDLVRSPKRN